MLHESGLRVAFFNPVRKTIYNLAITGLSVAICLFIGTIELLGLLPTELHLNGAFWSLMANFNLNAAGFVIVGMFISPGSSRSGCGGFAHIEQRWSARLSTESSSTN